MARAVTTDEKAALRQDGQWSEFFLAVLQPQTIYTARLASIPSSTDQVAQISFSSGSGTLSDVLANMTLYVGTSAGAYDLGMCRIRKAPIAGTFYIGEQSKIDWQSNAYLTVVNDFDLKAKHVHMDDGVAKMDYDTAYSDQHDDLKPVPILGPGVTVGKLVSGTCTVQLGPESGTASYCIGSSISSYAWTIPDATSISDDTAASPTADFDSVGWHIAYCVVTAANGKTKRGVRWVYVWDDDNLPATVFRLFNFLDSFEQGGIAFGVEMSAEADISEIRDRSLVCLFSVDHFGPFDDAIEGSLGPITGRENIRGIGRISGETIRYDSQAGTVTFDVMGYQHWFREIKAFPIGLDLAVHTPADWSEMPSLTVRRALWHLLEWQSTATTIMDCILTNNALYTPDAVSMAPNLWDQLEELAASKIFAIPGVDQYGRLFVQVDPQMVSEADRSSNITSVMDMTKEDLEEDISIERKVVDDISQIDLSGIACNSSGKAVSYYSLAPGHIFNDYGGIEVADRLLVDDQSDANEKAGLLLGWRNNPYPYIPLKLAQNNNFISCFPRQYITYEVETTDTPRGLSLSLNLIPRQRTLDFDNETGIIKVMVETEAESFEQVAVKGDVPASGGNIHIPGLPSLPPLPDPLPVYPGDTSSLPDGPPVVLLIDKVMGLLLSENFNEVDLGRKPEYRFINAGIDTADIPYIASSGFSGAVVTPGGAVYVPIHTPTNSHFVKIYYAPALGAPFTEIINQDYFDTYETEESGDIQIKGLGFNPNKPDEVVFIMGVSGFLRAWIGNGTEGFTPGDSWTGSTGGSGWGNVSFGNNKWIFDLPFSVTTTWLFRFNADCSSLEDDFNSGASSYPSGGNSHIRAGTSGIIFIPGAVYWARSEDNAVTIDNDTPVDAIQNSAAISYDGNYMMAVVLDGGDRGRTTDGGTTWTGIPNLTYGGKYYFAYAGGDALDSRWIAARGTVYYSNDFGESWEDRSGNLSYLTSFSINIRKIIIPGIVNQNL